MFLSGLTVEWSENNQKKRIINVPTDIYELGCIPDVEDGLKVSLLSALQYTVIKYTVLTCIIKSCSYSLPGCRENRLSCNG